MRAYIVPVNASSYVGIIISSDQKNNSLLYLNTSPKSLSEIELNFEDIKNINIESNIPSYIEDIANKISLIKQGFDQDTSNIALDYSGYTQKQTQVIKTAMKIPVNEIWPYSKVAEEAGLPKAQRFVGTTMRVLRQPYVVPVQRVKSLSYLRKKERKHSHKNKRMPI